MLLEILVVVALIALNGFLAMSELAIVSARRTRLKVMGDAGRPGARLALVLAQDAGRFLSTVQIGITLVGILAGAFSGTTLGVRASAWLAGAGVPAAYAETLGVGAVVVVITYLSLIVGELVPKQIALRAPERVAATVAPFMSWVATLTLPFVWLLDRSGKFVLRLLGQTGVSAKTVSDEEVRMVIAEAESAGVIETGERRMLGGVMRIADRSASGLMTPRREVELLDVEASIDDVLRRLSETARSRLPVYEGTQDNIIGVVNARAVLSRAIEDEAIALREMLQESPVVMNTFGALVVIERLRASPAHMVLVFDEYGHFEGLITAMDVLGAIAGDFHEEDESEPKVVRRPDGTVLVAGWMPVDEFADLVSITLGADRDYETVAGLILDEIGRIPSEGERLIVKGLGIEILDLDGQRIDKILVTPAS